MSPDEVNALIPELELIFQRLHSLKGEIVARANELERLGYNPATSKAKPRDLPPEVRERRKLLDAAVTAFEAEVERVGALGGILQDLELGLVDFHHVLDGHDIFLCWQYGERTVSHFHEVDAGFAGRRLLPGAAAAPMH